MNDSANRSAIDRLQGAVLALRYWRAAESDERHGLPFTAAMNWRKAAELSSWITVVANFYWRQWERVMHLPRRLAGPIGVEPATLTVTPKTSRHMQTSSRPFIQPQPTVRQAA